MSAKDILFLLTFAAGMGGFWLSGHLPGYLPLKALPSNALLITVVVLLVALLIYGVGMALWNLVVLRGKATVTSILASSGLVMTLALATSLILMVTKLGQARSVTHLAILSFVLYMLYGGYYVAGWALARRLSK